MMRLFRVELARFFSRRAIALLLLAAALFTGVVAAKVIWDTRPPTASEIATAKAQASLLANESTLRGEISNCRKNPTRYLGPGATAAQCNATLAGSTQSLLPRQTLNLRSELHGFGTDIAVLLVGVVVIAAATYIGGDWGSDSITTQLTFQPNRSLMWLAKAAVVVVASGVCAGVLLACYWGSLWITADIRDLPLTSQLFSQIAWQWGRAVLLAIAAGLGSFALTMFFRNTVATLALLFAYAAGGEVLINLIPVDGASRWSVGNNIYGWLQNNFSYVDPGVGCGPYSDCDATRQLAQVDAGWFLAVLLAVAVIPSFLTFLRRDI